MTDKQQRETLNYFRAFASQWQEKASGQGTDQVNVISQRNAYVIKTALSRGVKKALDVGCGTGELVRDLARAGIAAVGVDFAPEMIERARAQAALEKTVGATFVEGSIFDFAPGDQSFDLISANGFIEYISAEELRVFFQRGKAMLRPSGGLVVGSRNRLFNILSFNEYTQLEIECGAFGDLLREAVLINNSPDKTSFLSTLQKLHAKLPPLQSHPSTGIAVTTRYQYTPAQLTQLLFDTGLRVRDIYPVHCHAASPRFGRDHPDVYVAIADLLQRFASDAFALLPSASSFMVHAE